MLTSDRHYADTQLAILLAHHEFLPRMLSCGLAELCVSGLASTSPADAEVTVSVCIFMLHTDRFRSIFA